MAIKKNNFNKVKEKFSTSAKYKPQRFLDLGGDFLDAVGLPGPAIGHLNMFLGHSDTGKTTAAIKARLPKDAKSICGTARSLSFRPAFECHTAI